MKSVLIAPRKYVQGRGVLAEIGPYAKLIGKKPLVVWDETVKSLFSETVTTSMKDAGLELVEFVFQGEATKAEAQRVIDVAKAAGADGIIGIGGGKALDTAKGAAGTGDFPVITVPTVAATDTPTSSATVWYDADGNFEGFECWPFNPSVVLVDTQVIANAPVRWFTSGMGDAMSTWIEAEAAFKTRATNLGGGRATQVAMAVARLAFDNLLIYGVEAMRAVEKNLVTPAVEKIVETNVLMSGLGFESGGLTTAHMIANPLSNFPECKGLTHGEKVSFGVASQMVLDEDTDPDIQCAVMDFLIDIGLPVTFEELNLGGIDRARLKEIGDICAGEGSLCHNHCFEVTSDGVVDAMITADLLGKERKEQSE